MIVKAIIKKSPAGHVITEVVDRQAHLCSSVYTVTNALGEQKSDEDIGPECDPQLETNTESSK